MNAIRFPLVVLAITLSAYTLWQGAGFASCDIKECDNSDCWYELGYWRYNYGTAIVDYSGAGGGTRTEQMPVQTIQKRTCETGEKDCGMQATCKSQKCGGDEGDPEDAGTKHYCHLGT